MAAGAPHSAGVPALATTAKSTTQSAAAAINRIPDIRACSHALNIDLEWSFHEIVSVVEMFGSQSILDAAQAAGGPRRLAPPTVT